ncbi:MAG: ImmA/IrrE family metallo-endopeptidase, partial [Nitrospinae bacterium]|nr:ImmA/IrrE family metallo-endopeptidase [Nitrospinota bacterium]
SITKIESGYLIPQKEVLNRIALATGFPSSFFKQESFSNFPLGSLLFRKQASVNLREKYEASQYGKTIFEISHKLNKLVTQLPINLPSLTDGPITAANVTRSAMGLSPDTPIKKLIYTIEKNGVLVLAIPKTLEKRDAFSLWVEDDISRPVIAISRGKPGDRLRFSIAHEIGHLVMHKNFIRGNIKQVEKDADLFAGEFLLPENAMRNELTSPITLLSLAKLKLKWGVSIQALIVRAKNLGVITERQYKYLFKKLSIMGWRKKEPENLDIPCEKPRALRKMAEVIYGTPIDYKKFSSDMNLSPIFLKQIMEEQASKKDLVPQESLNTEKTLHYLFPDQKM